MRKSCFALSLALLAPALSASQTLKEKAGFGGNLSAVEGTAIFAAEIKYCEDTSPDFKTKAASSLAKLRNDPKYKELERTAEFAKVMPEASALVRERSAGAVVATTCRNTLERLR